MKLEPNNSPLINIYLFLLSLSLLYTTSPYLYTCCNVKQYQKKTSQNNTTTITPSLSHPPGPPSASHRHRLRPAPLIKVQGESAPAEDEEPGPGPATEIVYRFDKMNPPFNSVVSANNNR